MTNNAINSVKMLSDYQLVEIKSACRKRASATVGIGSTPIVDINWARWAEFLAEYSRELEAAGLEPDPAAGVAARMAAIAPDHKPFAS